MDRNVYSTFQPLLYQVATGGLNPSDVAWCRPRTTASPGADKHSLGLYTRHDAVTLRDQVIARLERLTAAPEDDAARDAGVTVVGGGATGVAVIVDSDPPLPGLGSAQA